MEVNVKLFAAEKVSSHCGDGGAVMPGVHSPLTAMSVVTGAAPGVHMVYRRT